MFLKSKKLCKNKTLNDSIYLVKKTTVALAVGMDYSPQFAKALSCVLTSKIKKSMIPDTHFQAILNDTCATRENIMSVFPKNKLVFFRTPYNACQGVGIVKGLCNGQFPGALWALIIEPLEVIYDEDLPKSPIYDTEVYPIFCVDIQSVNAMSQLEAINVVPLA